jgi:hypothetical protein
MKCWVCSRQARGYGHTDNRHGIGQPQRYPLDWVFCCERCQKAFHAMYGNWVRLKDDLVDSKGVAMVNLTEVEQNAMVKCLKAFGEAAGAIGFTKPLGDYSEPEALAVIDAIVSCFTQAMVEHHEKFKYPPVRGLPEVADPMANLVANPFADMENDLPWEDAK